MSLFVDSSGLLALLDRDDGAHAGALAVFAAARTEPLCTHAYVVVETLAVARRRFGAAAAARLIDDVLPAIDVVAVDADLHQEAVRDWSSPSSWCNSGSSSSSRPRVISWR